MTATETNYQSKRLLIANRGEIACRIMVSARSLGFTCIAVYADIDRHAGFVSMADEAYPLHGLTPQETYLNQAKIIDVAVKQRINYIHPGYGFLSENSEFAESCIRAGIRFVGPPASAILEMGDKAAAKKKMATAGVPLVPGYHGESQDPDWLYEQAESIGYPLLIKASHGGGGKGMRAVHKAEDFGQELAAAQREASNAFGNQAVLLEKLILNPRHVEVQIFFDQQGKGIYLFDRDCSVQRRHQKVIEEAPAPGLTDDTRKAMGTAALNCGKAIGYEGAGTVEFLVDAEKDFYFMEMNTRLQVEHPVTELITGIDLVAWQLKIASGEPLPLQQEEIEQSGHAVEARIYAEDAEQGFLPSIGQIESLRMADEADLPCPSVNFGILPRHQFNSFIRIDSGIKAGDQVSIYYDPMLAKVIAWGTDRQTAIETLNAALQETLITGIKTNTGFLQRVLNHPVFRSAEHSTDFLTSNETSLISNPCPDKAVICAATVLIWISKTGLEQTTNTAGRARSEQLHSPWSKPNNWRMNLQQRGELEFWRENTQFQAGITFKGNLDSTAEFTHFTICVDNSDMDISFNFESPTLTLWLEGEKHRFTGHIGKSSVTLNHCNESFVFEIPDDQSLLQHHQQISDSELQAPIAGCIVKVAVKSGERVPKGTLLLVMEAMKMEHSLYAPNDGEVTEILCGEGDTVMSGQRLIDFTDETDSNSAPAEVAGSLLSSNPA